MTTAVQDEKQSKELEGKILEYKKAVYEWGIENLALMKRGFPATPFPVPEKLPESEKKAKELEKELKDLKEPKLEDGKDETDPVYIDQVNDFIRKRKELQAKKEAAEAQTVTPALFWLQQRSQDSYVIDTPISTSFLNRIKEEIDLAAKDAEDKQAGDKKPTPAKPAEEKKEESTSAKQEESRGFMRR